MSKQITVTCDSCGVDIYGKKYFNLTIRKVMNGKVERPPCIYLCPSCYGKTRLAYITADIPKEGE